MCKIQYVNKVPKLQKNFFCVKQHFVTSRLKLSNRPLLSLLGRSEIHDLNCMNKKFVIEKF